MLEFKKLHLNAKRFEERLRINLKQNQGCVGFFFSWVLSDQVLANAQIITLVALSMESSQDKIVIAYLQRQKLERLSEAELIRFKTQALMGVYLYQWNLCSSFSFPMISLYQQDLAIRSLEESQDYQKECLDAFSIYCAIVYEHRADNQSYAKLYAQLGDGVQADIARVRYLNTNDTHSL